MTDLGDVVSENETRPTFAFCERVSATPTSKEHIREVGREGIKLGGGIPNTALCGYDVVRGWDLARPVTPDGVLVLSTPRPGDDRIFLCGDCASAFLAVSP